jgi:hypothetical protein
VTLRPRGLDGLTSLAGLFIRTFVVLVVLGVLLG